jgi:hypothetical protein
MGLVACKVLKIMPGSCIKGKMFADRIINQGGHVEGFIGKYADLLIDNPQLECYASIFTSQTDTALLECSDYYVHIEEEVEKSETNRLKNLINKEDPSCIDVEIETIDESKLFAVS